jgi:uncharacterized protein (TIRG00374 family)
MRNLGTEAPPLGESMRIYAVGLFLGGATPGQSGDFLKAWYLRERGQPLAPVLFSILIDRLFDFLLMALLSLLGLMALLGQLPAQVQAPVEIATIACVAAIVLAIPALMARRTRDWLMTRASALAPTRARVTLDRWRRQFATLDLRAPVLLLLLLASACSATVTMTRLWLLFRALEISIPILVVVGSAALISILQVLPISFSGVGVRDALLIPVLAAYGYGRDQALALSALFLLLNLEHILIGFLASLRFPPGRGAAADGPPSPATAAHAEKRWHER